ncbi:restriction endonuclease subunit S [Pseudogemmatithrix spongiicola]|uniref:Restriction endonuclease subunit S n=1 Tax=Pseudogemmatithrix spongiicola TaxID=3062599 RepID=A0AA49JYL9_9BACT|nr:restriction endonuclease subunit S [Gemmatimonadaceae bacterium 'strain 138']WKW14650.1 restriction endonuclease subunit S [Gemmatimonadaceae bacterium 'strain 318']
MSFPKYPSTRRWGSDGIAEVPEHWVERRLRDVARVVNGFPFDSSLFTPDKGLPLVRIRDLGRDTTEMRYAGDIVTAALIDATDVLIGMDGDFTVGRWLGSGQALLNQRVCCVRGRSPMITRFVEYHLPRPLQAINDVTYSTTVKHLSSGQVEAIRIVMPPLDAEVASVVHFLDRETAKIDALIAEQERLIALLQEKRQAVISRAVTKGLDPNAPMKDSGVQWIGCVPTHWSIVRIGRAFRSIGSGSTPPSDNASYYDDNGVEWINTGDLPDGPISSVARRVSSEAISKFTTLREYPAGAVVIAMYGATIGKLGILTRPAAVNQACCVLSDGDGVAETFLFYVMLAAREAIIQLATGGTQPNISQATVRAFSIPVPPIQEQVSLVAQLEAALSKFDALATDAESMIALLRERRTALITAAVTGQVDVRGLVGTAT